MGYREYSNQQHCLHWNHCGYFCHEVIRGASQGRSEGASQDLPQDLSQNLETGASQDLPQDLSKNLACTFQRTK